MQDTIITWNLENWVTVVLMAALAFVLMGLGMSFVKKRQGKSPQYGGGQQAQ